MSDDKYEELRAMYIEVCAERDRLRAALGEITQVAWAALNDDLAEEAKE